MTRRPTTLALRAATLCALAMSLVLAACASGNAPSSPAPPSGGETLAAQTPSVGATSQVVVPPAALSHLSLKLTPKWRGFASPLWLTNAGDGSGRLRRLEARRHLPAHRDNAPASPQPATARR